MEGQKVVAPWLSKRTDIREKQGQRAHDKYCQRGAYLIVAEMLEKVQAHEEHEEEAGWLDEDPCADNHF